MQTVQVQFVFKSNRKSAIFPSLSLGHDPNYFRSEEDSDSSSSNSNSNNSSICDVYVNKYMSNGDMASEMSNTEADDSERDDDVLSSSQRSQSKIT